MVRNNPGPERELSILRTQHSADERQSSLARPAPASDGYRKLSRRPGQLQRMAPRIPSPDWRENWCSSLFLPNTARRREQRLKTNRVAFCSPRHPSDRGPRSLTVATGDPDARCPRTPPTNGRTGDVSLCVCMPHRIALFLAGVCPLSAPAKTQILQKTVPISPTAGVGIRDRRDGGIRTVDDLEAILGSDLADAEDL